jgi:hypothetical protein
VHGDSAHPCKDSKPGESQFQRGRTFDCDGSLLQTQHQSMERLLEVVNDFPEEPFSDTQSRTHPRSSSSSSSTASSPQRWCPRSPTKSSGAASSR